MLILIYDPNIALEDPNYQLLVGKKHAEKAE